MANTQDKNHLEDARSRLERALSRLTQEVASSRAALELAESAQQASAQEQAVQAQRLQSLEQENLRLHEQIATLSLQTTSEDNSDALMAAEAEKKALQQNYELLKRQYTSLQDEFEGLQNRMDAPTSTADDAGDDNGSEALRREIGQLMRERDAIRDELDQAIAELENFVANNGAMAAGGMN